MCSSLEPNLGHIEKTYLNRQSHPMPRSSIQIVELTANASKMSDAAFSDRGKIEHLKSLGLLRWEWEKIIFELSR
jgi:hypothetical protein